MATLGKGEIPTWERCVCVGGAGSCTPTSISVDDGSVGFHLNTIKILKKSKIREALFYWYIYGSNGYECSFQH